MTKVKGAHCSGPINITSVDKNTSDTTLLVTVLGTFLYISLRMAGLEIERVEGLSSMPEALGTTVSQHGDIHPSASALGRQRQEKLKPEVILSCAASLSPAWIT